MRKVFLITMMCLIASPVLAADDFGARFQNIEPSAMMDPAARSVIQIEPASGDPSDMNAYVRGLFGHDMNGATGDGRIQSQPANPAKSPIVRIYAAPL